MKKSSVISAVLKLKLLLTLGVLMLVGNVPAQKSEHYNSPLYAPKTYDPSQSGVSSGLPPVLKTVGIEQNLNGQLSLDAEFKDENGNVVKLGSFFGKGRPVVLSHVY